MVFHRLPSYGNLHAYDIPNIVGKVLKTFLSSASRGTKSAVAAVFEHISVKRAASIETMIAIA